MILGSPAKPTRLMIVPRLPSAAKIRTGNPFTDDADVVVDCGTPGCGWHAMGTRKDMKQAVDNHHRLCHSDDVGVVLLNTPKQ